MHVRKAGLAVTLAAAAVVGFAILRAGDRGAFDFQAFYCAGAAAAVHADPYHAQPLGTCEHAVTGGSYAALAPDVILPAPLPGYDIALFSLFSRLPFPVAKALWGAVLGTAIAAALLAFVRVTRAPPLTVFMAFTASLIMPSFAFGEMFALYACACALAMYCALQEQWNLAGLCAALTLTEPHLGLPVCVALFVCAPQSRIAMSCSLALLAAISTLAVGWQANVEYIRLVLPLHAASEVSSDAQLSFSSLAYAVGFPVRQALAAGFVSYAAALVTGVWYGKIAAQRCANNAFLVAVPAAFALAGGSFVHATEFFAALPLVLLLIADTPLLRPALAWALALLAVPWFTAAEPGNAAAFAALCAIAVLALLRQDAGITAACACAAATFALLFAAPHVYAHAAWVHHPRPGARIDPLFPQYSWRAWNDRAIATGSAIAWTLRAASWSGLGLAVTSTILAVRRRVSAVPAGG